MILKVWIKKIKCLHLCHGLFSLFLTTAFPIFHLKIQNDNFYNKASVSKALLKMLLQYKLESYLKLANKRENGNTITKHFPNPQQWILTFKKKGKGVYLNRRKNILAQMSYALWYMIIVKMLLFFLKWYPGHFLMGFASYNNLVKIR